MVVFMAKESKDKKKGKNQSYVYYSKEGDKLERKRRFCPKCGVGYFLAEHKDRYTCGHCGYTEFKK